MTFLSASPSSKGVVIFVGPILSDERQALETSAFVFIKGMFWPLDKLVLKFEF